MVTIPDPVGRVVRDLGVVRGEARTAFLRLPMTDPARPLLDQVDQILSRAEADIGRLSQGATTRVRQVLPPSVTDIPSLKAWAREKTGR